MLTPYILDGDIETARNLSRVVLPLSGLEASEQPDGYSGFLTVKERTNSNMFFWFVLATVRFGGPPLSHANENKVVWQRWDFSVQGR